VNVIGHITNRLYTAKTLVETGIFRPSRPDKLLRIGLAYQRWGPTPALGYTGSAIRYPDETAMIDELGTLTFREVHERTNALAHALSDHGILEGDGVAIMCRNHRGFIDATVACSKLGANALYLNTAFAGPQITDVVAREKPVAIIYDAEFEELIHDAGVRRKRFIAWPGTDAEGVGLGGEKPKDPLLEDLIEEGDPSDVVPPSEKGRVVILTSGTTGTPKGASRKQPESLDPAAALFSKIPLRARETTMIAAPMFHSWGFAHFTLGMGLSSTLVIKRKFDPEATLSLTAQHEATALAVVPVMLQRMLELPIETIQKYDLSALRVIAASGSALPGELATRTMDAFGEVLYNLYGSTEVAWATIATPEDLRAAPGTAGRPPRGTIVKLFDEDGNPVTKPGETGRIFVANEMLFEGYTGGGNKDVIEGLMSTGDVGHFDDGGHLFVDGRDDEMIVSGGENVFPREVEDLLHDHEAIDEVAIIGVEDEKFGQRLKGYAVKAKGKDVSEADLKAYVKQNLAGYKVPREIVFVDELPRNATGTVHKRELLEQHQSENGE
jgi:fatty-acyl-CoA synthase